MPLPDGATRREIFNIRFRETPIDGDVDIDQLVEKTNGYSGAEVSRHLHGESVPNNQGLVFKS